jgi:hypothetical protein
MSKVSGCLLFVGAGVVILIVLGVFVGNPETSTVSVTTERPQEHERTDAASSEPAAPGPELVEHTVLRSWKPDRKPQAYGADLLVAPDVSEEGLRKLVRELSRGHDPVNIRVFSSRPAYDAEKNEQYGDAYARGYILFYVKNKTGTGAYRGCDEIRWMQEKGKFADKFGTKTKP